MYNVKRPASGGGAVRVTRKQAAAHREEDSRRRRHAVPGARFRRDRRRRHHETRWAHAGRLGNGHFASKGDLAAEITARVLGKEGWPERLTGTANPSFGDVVRAYLSPAHRDAAGRGCMLAAVGSDVVRQPRRVRHAFTEGLRARVEALRKLLPGASAATKRERALTAMRRSSAG